MVNNGERDDEIGLAFFAESREEAVVQAEAWGAAEPYIRIESIDRIVEKTPGHWAVFVTIVSTKVRSEELSLGL